VKELKSEESSKITAELEDLHGQAIAAALGELYTDQPATVGVALVYLGCGCVLLRGFEKSGDIVGHPRILATKEDCNNDHDEAVDELSESVIYASIFWKDAPEEFDRKYGNEKRIEIASRLFPPPLED
jgi:hypothetical protein